VEVHDGQVVIGGKFDDATDQNMATMLAQTTGVTGVHTIGSGETP
jgi:osmotically-inducible protein OsmY